MLCWGLFFCIVDSLVLLVLLRMFQNESAPGILYIGLVRLGMAYANVMLLYGFFHLFGPTYWILAVLVAIGTLDVILLMRFFHLLLWQAVVALIAIQS